MQAAHEAMLQYGSMDLQALLQITGEGGAWCNPALVALLTGQSTDEEELNAYLALEGDDFLEMRIKHLEKVGEVEKALILTKACGKCSLLPGQATFRQTFVTQLCQLLPSEEAIIEISRLDGQDVLDIICKMESENDESTAFILCTTYFTQQLQQESLYCSWELTLLWSKLQRRIDGSLESFLERCLQFGAIAKNVYHLLFLIRVIQTETMHFGLAVSVELCVKALQIPRQEDTESKTTVCKTVTCLLPDDLEVLRACQLTEFLLSPSQEVYDSLEDLYGRPDQKYDEENAIIPNSLRCELLLALKAHWPFDPEFWDWKTLKHYCIKLLGLEPEEEESEVVEDVTSVQSVTNEEEEGVEKETEDCHGAKQKGIMCLEENEKNLQHQEDDAETSSLKGLRWSSNRAKRWQKYKFLCQICHKEVIEPRLIHHSRKHLINDVWTCPLCLQRFENKDDLVVHSKKHLQMPTRACHYKKKKVKKKEICVKKSSELEAESMEDEFNDLEPGQIPLDPSLVMYYQSTHDPVVLEHILEQAATVPKTQTDDDDEDYITFDYIYTHFKLQDRELYPCPATDCSKIFKLFKYLGVHLKNEHDESDPNVKHYLEMKDRREKCTFCRRTFMSGHHHKKHRRVHYGENPYMCVVEGCSSRFSTTNELLAHKHSHGFLLAYHCELKGCSISFCDLGQLYHHEAQHFRDAAYTCTSPGCKKFYYCRKEFLKHLDSHGITFTEKDFDAQRKAKRKLLLPVLEEDLSGKVSQGPNKELLNGAQKHTPSQHHLECKESESKGSLTYVAVCFDGKTFTCGLQKCGRTFSKAREIQKHLKIAHPGQFKEEKVCRKMGNEETSKDMPLTDHKGSQDECPSGTSSQGSSQENVFSSANCARCESAPSSKHSIHSCHFELSSALTELVLGLSQLSLNSAISSSIRHNPHRHISGSKVPQVPCLTTANVKSPAKATPNKTESKSQQAPAESKKLLWQAELHHEAESSSTHSTTLGKTHLDDKTESSLILQPASKPYTCHIDGCDYGSVTSDALIRHYVTKHGYSKMDVKQKEIFIPLKFKPFKCRLCSNVYKERKGLRVHYRHKHNTDIVPVEEQANGSLKEVKGTTIKTNSKESSAFFKEDSEEKRNSPALKDRVQNKERNLDWVGKVEKSEDKMTEEKRPSISHLSLLKHSPSEGKTIVDGATPECSSQNVVPNRNKCVDVTGEDKSYNCVHKGCGAIFTKKWNLERHMQNIHNYNTSQICWEEDGNVYTCKHNGCNKSFTRFSSLTRHYRKLHQVSEEPIPRFKCTYANCNAFYHLKSSLLRHNHQMHQNQTPLKPISPSSAPPSHSRFSSFKKHIFYRRCDSSVPSVVRLQSAQKRYGSNSGCQKKVIMSSSTQSLKTSQRLPVRHSLRCCRTDCDTSQAENFEEAPEGQQRGEGRKPKSVKRRGEFVYRTPEEALQMCQDRCLPVAHPCMVQNCDSVVSSMKSLHRHYITCHKMIRTMLSKNQDKLFYTAEKLEELIQKKSAVSALPDLTRVPNGVLKMEYQAEPENPGGPSLPMSLHSIKNESMGKEGVQFPEEPCTSSAIIVADDVLHGESNGHVEEPEDDSPREEESPPEEDSLPEEESPPEEDSPPQEEQTKAESPAPPLVPPPLLDLSPPATLRITLDEVSPDPLAREGMPVSVPATICIPTNLSQTRQPLRRKNSELSESLPTAPHPPAQKDQGIQSLSPKSFDIAAYKPLGFESSFLKFIQEKEEHLRCDRVRKMTVLNTCYKPDPARRRDVHRRKCSVKENNQRGPSISRGKRSRTLPLKPLLSKGECSSIQNLRFILERALRGCGDQAIKQLQFLKPVVVLERTKSSASLLDLLPSKTKA